MVLYISEFGFSDTRRKIQYTEPNGGEHTL